MRSSTRPLLFALVIGWITLVTPPASAQNGSAWLTPKSNHPVESAREVVLTVSMWRPSQVEYRTFDGDCDVGYDSAGGAPNPTCSDRTKKAHAPDDYTATSGELVFTTGGSKTITIPIANDDLAEGIEAFTLAAWEEANADPCGGPSVCVDRSDSVVIHINDDDPKSTPDSSTSPARSNQQSGGSRTGSLARPPAPPTTAPASSGSTDGVNESGGPDSNSPPLPIEVGDEAETKRYVAQAVRSGDGIRSRTFLIGGIGTLVLVLITAGSRLKKRFARSVR